MNDLVKYVTDKGDVELSPQIIRKYLVSGKANLVTEQEIMMFLKLCQYQKLNPFLREAYLIKFGSSPATIVTGKETFLKRAKKNPAYKGHEAGTKADGKIGWAKVYVDGYQVPIYIEVDYAEYVGKKGDGTINRMWKTKPNTMLRKVALVQALREAFPDDFGGMYSPEEINHIESDKLESKPINKKPGVEMPEEIEDAIIEEPEEKKIVSKPKKKKVEKKAEPEPEESKKETENDEPIAKEQIKNIHTLAGKYWGKDFKKPYKQSLLNLTGKDTSTDLTFAEAENIIAMLSAALTKKFNDKKKGGK